MNQFVKPKRKKTGGVIMHPARRKALDNNEPLYNTGKPCKHGHLSDRYTYSGFCKKCHSEILVKNQRKYNLKRYYGITKEQYDKMFMEQNGLCKICNKPETTIDGKTKKLKTMSVDHCHDTNKIRGILCNNCNQGLGKFKHNPILLRQAALYCEVK